jgi:hypothetical protein
MRTATFTISMVVYEDKVVPEKRMEELLNELEDYLQCCPEFDGLNDSFHEQEEDV